MVPFQTFFFIQVCHIINSLFDFDKRHNNGESPVKTKYGHIQIWDFYSAYIGKLQDGRKMVMSVAIDITERKKAEEELKTLKAQPQKHHHPP